MEEVLDPVLVSVAAYSAHADAYEERYAPKMLEHVERFGRSLPVPSQILDAGCGPGRDLARFRALGHEPRGVELNMEFAARAAAHAPVLRADLRRVASLFPSGTFDGVWACSSLVHLTEVDTADVLRQFAQLLRAEGRLYACVNTFGRTGWLDEPDGRRWYTIWEPDAFAQAVADAGFRVERVDTGPVVEVWARRDGGMTPPAAGEGTSAAPPAGLQK